MSYKVNIDVVSGDILYTGSDGHVKSIRLGVDEFNYNHSLLDNVCGKDGFLIGTLFSAKAMDKLSVFNVSYNYKYLVLTSVLFVTIMFVSNILSTKLVSIFGVTVTGALLIYPFSYIFDYIITDVYGFQIARRVLWSVILSLLIFNISIFAVIYLPPSKYWPYQSALYAIFFRMLRTFVASTVAFSFSFFISSYVLQILKIKLKGGHFFKRMFASLLISEICDTWIFCLIAFLGVWPLVSMLKFMTVSYFTKISYELLIYPFITKPIVSLIKKAEKMDIVDNGTNFTPFSWKLNYTKENNIYKE